MKHPFILSWTFPSTKIKFEKWVEDGELAEAVSWLLRTWGKDIKYSTRRG